jgi:hypothetical protein
MTTPFASFGDLTLDGVKFRLASPLQQTKLNTYPGKITIGDYTVDSDPRLSFWGIRDVSGGHGLDRIDVGVDQNRCRLASLTTRYPGQLAPQQKVYQYTAAADTTGARPLGDLYESGTYKFYAAYGTKLVRWDETGLAFSASLGTLSAVPVNKAVEFVGTGTRRLFVPMGATGYATWTGAAFANVAASGTTPGVQAFCLWDNKLVALSTAGHLWYTTDGTAWTDWNATSPLATVDASYIPRNLVTYVDASGNPTIFVITNRGALSFDPNGPRLYAVEALDWPPHPYQALGSCKWRGHLFITIGMGTRRYTGDIAQPMGLDRDHGVFGPFRSRVLDCEPEANGLYQLVTGDAGGGVGAPSLHVWTDFGWHTVWWSVDGSGTYVNQTISKTTWTRASEAQGVHRIWWGDGTGNLKTMKLPVTDANPKALSDDGNGDFSNDYFELQTGRFDAGMHGYDKVADSLQIAMGGTNTTGSIAAYYRLNNDIAGFTTLASQSFAAGVTSLVFNQFGDLLPNGVATGDYEGLRFREIEFKVAMVNCGGTSCAYIEDIGFYFMKIQPPARAWTATVDLTAGNFGQSPEDLLQKLHQLMDDGLFFEAYYRDSPEPADYLRVRLTGVDNPSPTGQDQRSQAIISLLEVPSISPEEQ